MPKNYSHPHEKDCGTEKNKEQRSRENHNIWFIQSVIMI